MLLILDQRDKRELYKPKNCEDTKTDRNMSNEVVKQCMTFWGRSSLLKQSAADKQAAPHRKIMPVVQIILLAFTFV